MRIRLVLTIALIPLLTLAFVPAATTHMPIGEVKPGMIGVGRTVFEGTRVDEFRVRILGVLRNAAGPQRTLILARLDGGPLADAGVIAGMSGSPVYVDRRLVGAIAYSVGSFAKEPIAGITPIGEMVAAVRLPARPRARPAGTSGAAVGPDMLARAVRGALPRLRPFADRPGDVQWISGAAGAAGNRGLEMSLRPIQTPLVFAGFTDDVRSEIGETFGPAGFLPMAGSGSDTSAPPTAAQPDRAPLQPGDAVGVELISGDFSLAATGTVTEVSGSEVYAFGHDFYNLGPTRFPMTRAYVHGLLPSLQSSSKITTTGETIGAFLQDRTTVLAGRLGEKPAVLPVSIVLEPDGAPRRTFQVNVVRDQLLTAYLVYTTVANILVSYEREQGASTFAVKGSATVRGHAPVVYDNVFVDDSAPTTAASSIATPLLSLLNNEFEDVELERLSLTITPSEQRRSATVVRAWLDTDRPRAGRTVGLRVVLRDYRGEEEMRTLPIEIPARATGSLTLLVSGAAQLTQWEQREYRSPEPWTVDQTVAELNRARRANRLYVRLVSGAPGALVNGERLPALPPSVLAVYEADRNSGSFAPLRNALLGEWEIVSDVAVLGSRQLTFSVEPER